MKALIETYRGWEISFDTEKESFYCHSEQYDTEKTKQSYASVKKFIDDFIKENETFKPIVVETLPESYNRFEIIKLIGIRRDGRFIYEGNNGEKVQLSDYQEKDYIIRDPNNDKYRKEADEIQKQIDALRDKRQAVLNQIKGVLLTEYKKTITQ